MKWWLVVGGGVLVVLWGGFLYQHLSSPEPDRPLAAAASGIEQDMGTHDSTPRPAVDSGKSPPAQAPRADTQDVPNPLPSDQPTAVQDDDVDAMMLDTEPPEAVGPLAELKGAFARTKRDAGAAQAEARIRSMFQTDETPADMLIAVTCRATMCRVELEWSSRNALGYMALLMRLSQDISPDLAVEPTGPLDPEGHMPVDVYVPREGYTLDDFQE